MHSHRLVQTVQQKLQWFLSQVEQLVQLIFPSSSDEHAVQKLSDTDWDPRTRVVYNLPLTVCMDFSDSRVRSLIHTLKYHHHSPAIHFIARNLTPLLISCVEARPDVQLVPIPLSSSRERDRGFNQVLVVLKLCIEQEPRLASHLDTSLIIRSKHTAPQTSLKKSARLKNMRHAFAPLRYGQKNSVILIDDVATTGATLDAAARACRAAGATSVSAIVFSGKQ